MGDDGQHGTCMYVLYTDQAITSKEEGGKQQR
jgi:hypothetical protein